MTLLHKTILVGVTQVLILGAFAIASILVIKDPTTRGSAATAFCALLVIATINNVREQNRLGRL